MKLLLDAGNTCIKWGIYDGQSLIERGSLQHRGVDPAAWTRELPPRTVTGIIAANVAGEGVARVLAAWGEERLGLQVRFPVAVAAAGGIRNGYAVPELLGVDRWFGMIGVRRRCREAFLLVAAGTAFTIDLVDNAGQHLGGVIVPGHSMMIDVLKERTGNIAHAAATAAGQSAGMFGLNTSGAIERGASHALAALVRQAIQESHGHCGRVRLFVHGGNAADVFDLVASQSRHQLKRGVEQMPDAVLTGLAVFAADGEPP